MLLFLLAVTIDQVMAEPPPALPLPAAPPHNYLKPPSSCAASQDNGEVVICGNKDIDTQYRLKPIDDRLYADPPIRAETNVAGGVLGTTAQQVSLHGFPSNRVMLNFKIKF